MFTSFAFVHHCSPNHQRATPILFQKTSAQQTVYFKHRPIYRIGNAINIHRAITFFPPEAEGRFCLARPAPLNAIAYLTGVGQTKSSVLALWNAKHISLG